MKILAGKLLEKFGKMNESSEQEALSFLNSIVKKDRFKKTRDIWGNYCYYNLACL